MSGPDLNRLEASLAAQLAPLGAASRVGHVTAVKGSLLRAEVPDVGIGELCRIRSGHRVVLAEVTGFDREDVLLLPLHPLEGLAVRAEVEPIGSSLTIPVGAALLGRVIDALGNPIDGKGPIDDTERAPLRNATPDALTRQPVDRAVETGVRAIDGLLTVGRGQRVGIFAAAGIGKSTLLGAMARNVSADRVVVGLIGERGREVREFLEKNLRAEGLAKATVVVSTSDEPSLLRARAAYAATAIAEAARARGEHVVLMMDSVTRYARALREIGLSIGEPPTRQGYPVSVYTALPQLFERAGNDHCGSITAFYTVLLATEDQEDPIGEEAKSLLDGHIVLSSRLAERQQYPAIDIRRSKSRVMKDVVSAAHMRAASAVNTIMAIYEENYHRITMDYYTPTEEERPYFERRSQALAFLNQNLDCPVPMSATTQALLDDFGGL